MAGFTLNRGFPTPPPEAVAAGYTNLIFFDDFDDINTIDVANTLATGFKWYRSTWPVDPLNVYNSIAMSNSLLTISGTQPYSTQLFTEIMSLGYISPGVYVGTTFSGATGFYAEASMAFDSALANSGASQGGHPTFWMMDYKIEDHSSPAPFLGYVGAELDIFEAYQTTAGKFQPFIGSGHIWKAASPTSTNLVSNLHIYPGGITYNNQNIFGTLVIPMARNGGTGINKTYLNGVHQAAYDITWTPGSTWSPIEKAGFILFMDCGFNWPSIWHWVAVWGPP